MNTATKTRDLLPKTLRKSRPMTSVTFRMSPDFIDELKRIAPKSGYSGYQPLIRAYISRGLRSDLLSLESGRIPRLVKSLRRHGIAEEVIAEAVADAASH